MILRLPEGAFSFLDGFVGSVSFWLLLFALTFVFVRSWYESGSFLEGNRRIHQRSPWGMLYGIFTLVAGEVLLSFLGLFQFQFLDLFLRNLFVLVLGLWLLPGVIHGTWTSPGGFTGRSTPVARLVLAGVVLFLATGLVFWGISYFWPFSVVVQGRGMTGMEMGRRLLFGVILIPVTEELVFRGYLQQIFVQYVGVTGAVLGASVLFAVAHSPGSGMFPILAGGLVMGILMEVFGSILPGLVVHSGFNFLLLCGGSWIS